MFKSGKNFAQSFARDDRGATAIEYGLIAAIIGLGIIAGATVVTGSLNDTFTGISDAFDTILAG